MFPATSVLAIFLKKSPENQLSLVVECLFLGISVGLLQHLPKSWSGQMGRVVCPVVCLCLWCWSRPRSADFGRPEVELCLEAESLSYDAHCSLTTELCCHFEAVIQITHTSTVGYIFTSGIIEH